MATSFYPIANAVLRLVFRVTLDLKITGMEHLPPRGALIVAINHSSFLDPLLVGAYMKRDVVMMSKIENFRLPVFGWIVQAYGAFPIHRGEVDRTSLKKALEVLRGGEILLMAPEGTRSKDGQLQTGHDGLAMLAARTAAPILPFAIAGAKRFWKNLALLRRTRVRIAVGPSFTLPQPDGKADRDYLAQVTDQIMLRLAELLPPEQRGVYAERVARRPSSSPDVFGQERGRGWGGGEA